MSVVINTNPTGKPSVHDNMWHVVSSDNSGATDFKYVFDVYVNGVQKIRVKQFPEPSNGRGYFDAGPTVRNEMLYNWFEPINSNVLVDEPDMSGQIGIIYALRVGEEVSGITTLNMASGEVSGYNWAPPLFQRRVITIADKVNKWLTNRPNFGKAVRVFGTTDEGENLFIGFHTDQSSLTMHVESYTESGAVIDTAAPIVIPVTTGFLQMNIGPPAILSGVFGGFVIEEPVHHYDVWFNSYDHFRVYLTCNPKYTCIPVHFLNRWGTWDTLRFDLASRLSMDIERKGFGQRDHKFNGSSVDYMSDANRYYEGKINYSNKQNWTYKLNADALTDEEWEWASDLISSPQILMEIDGYFYPVTIKKNNYDYMKFVNDRLKPLEIEFELNTSRYSQLR